MNKAYMKNEKTYKPEYANTVCRHAVGTDKNGHLVYLGDIVKSHLDDLFPEDEMSEIIVRYGSGFAFQQGDYPPEPIMDGDLAKCEVIGNSFNAHLIGEGR